MDYDVKRHEKRWEETPLYGACHGGPPLPPFQRAPKVVAVGMHTLCECGRRRGMHRYGDEACPNPHWSTGNGQGQFLRDRYFRLPL